MSAEQIFSLCNPLAIAGWVLLIVAPRRHWAALIAGRVIPLLLASVYLVVIALNWAGSPGGFALRSTRAPQSASAYLPNPP